MSVFPLLVIVHSLAATVWTGGHLVLDLGVLRRHPAALWWQRAGVPGQGPGGAGDRDDGGAAAPGEPRPGPHQGLSLQRLPTPSPRDGLLVQTSA